MVYMDLSHPVVKYSCYLFCSELSNKHSNFFVCSRLFCLWCLIHLEIIVYFVQPKKIEEIKDFLITARRKDAKCKYLIFSSDYYFSVNYHRFVGIF